MRDISTSILLWRGMVLYIASYHMMTFINLPRGWRIFAEVAISSAQYTLLMDMIGSPIATSSSNLYMHTHAHMVCI